MISNVVQEISDAEQFQAVVQANRTVVIDFYAVWCGPCKAAAPMYQQLAMQYYARDPSIVFAKIDVDEVEIGVSEVCGVTAMPTIVVIHDGVIVGRTTGLDVNSLHSMLSPYTHS